MLVRLLLFLVLFSIAELTVLVWLAREAGVLLTIAILLVAGFVGAAVAQWQGLRAWRAVRADLAARRPPAASVIDGVMILLAGALLVLPGLISDLLALLLLLVPRARAVVRDYLVERLRRRVTMRFETFAARAGSAPSGEVIDAEFRRADAPPIEEHPSR